MKKSIIILTLILLLTACGGESTPVTEATETATEAATEKPEITEAVTDPVTEPVTEPATEALDDNPLMNATLSVDKVRTGGGDIIGQRGHITIDKETFLSLTSEEIYEFYEVKVAPMKFNWFTIFFGDGTGIHTSGSGTLLTYSKVDREGGLSEDWDGAVYMIYKDGVYEGLSEIE